MKEEEPMMHRVWCKKRDTMTHVEKRRGHIKTRKVDGEKKGKGPCESQRGRRNSTEKGGHKDRSRGKLRITK